MSKALSFMVLGAVTAASVVLYMEHKDEIRYKMHQMKQAGMDKINKVKATME